MDVKLNDLPDLPFEKILGYLSLEDRIKCRAVSRNECTHDVHAFARNFISSTRFELFFQTLGQSILANLKHLRICDLRLDAEKISAFVQALNSFGRLEKLDIIRFDYLKNDSDPSLELNLPMLNSLHLEEVWPIKKLTLDTPKLQNVKILIASGFAQADLLKTRIEVKKMKNLKILYTGYKSTINSTLLSDLPQLNEIHLYHSDDVSKLFKQKQLHERNNLKIFLCGLLLDGPNDPVIGSLTRNFREDILACLAANPLRLTQEIPFIEYLEYTVIDDGFLRGSDIDLLKRFTDLDEIYVSQPVQHIERFLQILKNMDNIDYLWFNCDQPQELFDRLPEDCATLQRLTIFSKLSDFSFLPKLSNLTELIVNCSIDIESVRKILEDLQFLSELRFGYFNKRVAIDVKHHSSAKWFKVSVDGVRRTEAANLDPAI
ncbi:hypothetical protein L1887_57615 [Cichorium endivia]|nr:hypothetical protein L1887_57615 [Cichorium endivia]